MPGTPLRVAAVLVVLALAAAAIYLAAGLRGGVSGVVEAYGACYDCGGTLICEVILENPEDSILTISSLELSAGNSTVALKPAYNYTSIPGRSQARLVVRLSGDDAFLLLEAPRYTVETLVAEEGALPQKLPKPRSVFNETWVSPEGSLEGFYPIMLEHRCLVTGPRSASYIVLRASPINANLSMLHVKLYAFHDELVYEKVLSGLSGEARLLIPLYYADHEALSGATSLLLFYRLEGRGDSMLVVEAQAWRTTPIHLGINVLTGKTIDTYLPLIPGSVEPGLCTAQHS